MTPQHKTKTRAWLHNMGVATIGGGAGAVTSTLTVSIIKPGDFSIMTQTSNFLTLAFATFIVNAFFSLFFYLKQSPLPPEPDEPDEP